jgi:hypothetical protein
MSHVVIPAEAGTHEHFRLSTRMDLGSWVPAVAGMTVLA